MNDLGNGSYTISFKLLEHGTYNLSVGAYSARSPVCAYSETLHGSISTCTWPFLSALLHTFANTKG